MPLVLLPSCTRFDVLNFLEHFCSLLLQCNHSVICTTWPPMHCAFAAPSIQCAHAPAMVRTRHMFSVRLACTLTLPLQVGILQSPLSITFLFFKFIMGLLLGLHASPAVSSFQDAPKASLGDDTPAIEQIVAIAPIAGRDRGDDRCCRRSLKALTKRL